VRWYLILAPPYNIDIPMANWSDAPSSIARRSVRSGD
jgi:hypothetical protein